MPELPTYGGQAVIEGVMMRGARFSAVAVRAPDQSIVIDRKPLAKIYQSKLTKIPFLRGLLILWDALALGMRSLAFSANIQAEEEDERIEGVPLTITLIGSLAVGVSIFFLLPAGVAQWLGESAGWSPLMAGLIEGLLRLGLLVSYVGGIGLMADIRRVYGYHGAEHKTINAFEAGAPLEVEDVARFPIEHPRCGTAFLLTVAIFSIIAFSLLGPMPLLARLVSRILLIPVLASMAYEYIRFSARFASNPLIKLLIWPNLALQRLTTREPSESMLEVAISSFQAMRESEVSADSPA
jgi:uncharacterized protein YqhQ